MVNRVIDTLFQDKHSHFARVVSIEEDISFSMERLDEYKRFADIIKKREIRVLFNYVRSLLNSNKIII